MSETSTTRRKPGGLDNHKPACPCRPCTARRRKAKAIAGAAGDDPADRVITASPESLEDATASPEGVVLDADCAPEDAPEPQFASIRVRKPNYYRSKTNPQDHKERSAKARVAEWIRLRALNPGISNAEVARRQGISTQYLSSVIWQASKAGWLKFNDPISKLEHQLLPKIVRNLDEMLDARSEKITIEAAKGTLFPMFKDSKGINEAPSTAIALKLEMPEPGQIVSGTILGRPKALATSTIDDDD